MGGSHRGCRPQCGATARLPRRSIVAAIFAGAAVALTAQAPSPGRDYPPDGTAAAWDTFQRAKQSEYRGPHRPRPRFAATVEEFPLHIPPGKELGRTIGVSRAPNGDLYLIQWSDRGVYIPARKETRLPDLMRFDANGRYITGWGAESVPGVDGIPQWPRNPENVEIDDEGNVWVTGYDPDDDAILKYSRRPPGSLKPGEGFSIPVHKIARSPDGLIYVCDRRNNRVQEFELVPGGVRYRREVYVAPGSIGMGSAADIAFTPDNRFMFVSDMMGMRVWTVDRRTFDVLGWTNAAPEHEGDDNIAVNKIPVHRMALLPNGDFLVTRTRRGIQRLKFIGVS